MHGDMGHSGRDPLSELRALARQLREEAQDASLPIDTLSPAPVRLPLRAASATSAPILIALTAALVVLLVGGGAGVATAANRAIPGDRMYSVDLFLEDVTDSFGLTTSHASERFAEAASLLEQGDLPGALETAWAGAVEPIDGSSADLQVALGKIEALAGVDPSQGAASLKGLLNAAAHIDEAPTETGAVIAQIARTVPSAVVGAVDGTPGGSPEFTPPGQDPEFTPPGQDPEFTPPGQDPEFTPPGQDPEFTPPGQDPEFTPPGRGNGQGDSSGSGK
jgi:hypothetical protein